MKIIKKASVSSKESLSTDKKHVSQSLQFLVKW